MSDADTSKHHPDRSDSGHESEISGREISDVAVTLEDEATILPVVDNLDPDALPTDEESRIYNELFALLPAALEPVAPRAEARSLILGAIADDTAPVTAVDEPVMDASTVNKATVDKATVHTEAPVVASMPPRDEMAITRAETAVTETTVDHSFAARQAAKTSSARSPWALAMAAALAFAIAGLAYLGGQNAELRVANSRLETELSLVQLGNEASSVQSTGLVQEVQLLRSRLDMIANTARQAYPMNAAASAGDARGVIFVCGAHQQWYLNVQGLSPAPDGYEYHLWFVTANGPVDGGALGVGAQSRIELEDMSMPIGTKGFQVTLEDVSTLRAKPAGEIVMVGDTPFSL
ncbi:MAG: anti-sigma factor [Acidobacteriota bacterium]